jgi:hypothetical protein
MPAGHDDTRPALPHPRTVNTAAVIGNAMTDYLLAAGTNKAPATGAPAHVAAWLEARGYRIVRSPVMRPVDPGDLDQVARIVGSIDWHPTHDECGNRRSIVRQVLATAAAAATVATDTRRVA